MPINFKNELNRRKADTNLFLDSLQGDSTNNIAATRDDVSERIGSFMGKTVSPNLAQYGVTPTAGGESFSRNNLNRELTRNLAQRSMTNNRSALDMTYQNAVRRAEQAGLDLNASKDYARQLVAQKIQQDFQASETNADMVAGNQRSVVANEYAKKGITLQNQYMPDMGYEAAVYRALFGLGGSAATGAALGAFGNRNKTATPKTAGVENYGGNY